MDERIEKVRERIKREIEYMQRMREKKGDDAGRVVWLMVTLVPGLLKDLGIDELEPHWEFISNCLGEVLNNNSKFLKLKEILGIDK
jgi:hypothetical protein